MGHVVKQCVSVRLLTIAALIGLGFATSSAGARVVLDHQRVTVRLVGGISARPCPDPLRWGSFHALHHVRCLRPRALQVVAVKRHRATVFACSRLYRWSLP
jgi:hypothetical protein